MQTRNEVWAVFVRVNDDWRAVCPTRSAIPYLFESRAAAEHAAMQLYPDQRGSGEVQAQSVTTALTQAAFADSVLPDARHALQEYLCCEIEAAELRERAGKFVSLHLLNERVFGDPRPRNKPIIVL